LRLEKNPQDIYKAQLRIIENKLSVLFSNKFPESLYEPSSFIIKSGGKRLRPLLVLFSKKAVNGNFKDAYNAAIALELLHTFTLIHDDIMDNADKRRGIPTIHKKYDLSTAILTGDNLLAIAYSYLLKDCKDNYQSIINYFTNGVIEICEGQSLDKEFEIRSDVTLKEYKSMITKKTAVLFEACCSIGALLGGANTKQLNALSKYGRNLGIAFQIQDDLLDITANETEFGKIIGGDIIEGKKTYLFLKAMEKAKGSVQRELELIIDNKGASKQKVNICKKIYSELGIIEEAKKEIKKYSDLALKELDNISDKKDRIMLTWIADLLINRNK
jgi:geranylgeranyl diphosphate synthase, type II